MRSHSGPVVETAQENSDRMAASPPPISPFLTRYVSMLFFTTFSFTIPMTHPPPSHALSSNFDALWQISPTTQKQPFSKRTTGFSTGSSYEQLKQQQNFQDKRLAQCEDNSSSGPDTFEQCFFYGTHSPQVPSKSKGSRWDARTSVVPEAGTSHQMNRAVKGSRSGDGIPTW